MQDKKINSVVYLKYNSTPLKYLKYILRPQVFIYVFIVVWVVRPHSICTDLKGSSLKEHARKIALDYSHQIMS